VSSNVAVLYGVEEIATRRFWGLWMRRAWRIVKVLPMIAGYGWRYLALGVHVGIIWNVRADTVEEWERQVEQSRSRATPWGGRTFGKRVEVTWPWIRRHRFRCRRPPGVIARHGGDSRAACQDSMAVQSVSQ
jgi:hypothetical protein